MTFSVRYDVKEDRMRVILHPSKGSARVLYVTRRQWIALLQAVGNLVHDEYKPNPKFNSQSLSQSRVQSAPENGSASPIVVVKKIQFQSLPEGAKIVFTGGVCNIELNLNDNGLRQLKYLLRHQAELADWDVVSAMKRLNSIDIIRAHLENVTTH